MKLTLSRLASVTCLFAPMLAAHAEIEEITVTSPSVKHTFLLHEENTVTVDPSQLLKKVAGGNVNGNGPLSGIPQYRGLSGHRMGVSINGANVGSAGPNLMDPPLSYVAPAHQVRLEVYRGVSPVSVTQESIGGLVSAETINDAYTQNANIENSGSISTAVQSASDSFQLSGQLNIASKNSYASLALLTEEADNADFPQGRIASTEYDRQRAQLNLGHRVGAHSFSLAYTRNETGTSGTAALPMDIDYINGDLINFGYQYSGSAWDLQAKVYVHDLDHEMTNYLLRPPPPSLAMWRRNTATANNYGASIKATNQTASGRWSVGVDYTDESHDSNIDNPNNARFFAVNFNNASRSILGAFVERDSRVNERLRTQLGLRVNHVSSDADEVNATPAMMMPPARMLRDIFNAADRDISDTNVDAIAKLWFDQTDAMTWYVGVGHKTRSPSYIERYLWLPLQSTGGLADGLTYTGNLELKPEQSLEIELGFDLTTDSFSLSPRLFQRSVDDYIQGTPTNNQAAAMFVSMMNNRNGTNNPAPLQFNNVDATLTGIDMEWAVPSMATLGNAVLSLDGILSYVRGERDDIDDNLYRIAPLNSSLRLNVESSTWGGTLEWQWYDDQDKVSATNAEQTTEGYNLFNVVGWYQFSEALKMSFGVENINDELYFSHLNGYNRVRNSDVELGGRLPGVGRNFFLRANYHW